MGASSAALCPLPTADYPLHASPAAPSVAGSTLNGAGAVLPAYSTVGGTLLGPYRAFRNDLYVFPTQAVAKADWADPASKASVVTQGATTRTFWQLTAPQLGAATGALDVASDGTA